MKFILFIFLLSMHSFAQALDPNDIEKKANISIQKLYHSLKQMKNTSMSERIDKISNYFKDSKYSLGALGEGASSAFDQFPLYRTDVFDCDTYVNTVIALAISDSLKSFQQCIAYLRYKEGRVSYITRNHFTSLDWNINNQNNGVLEDITLKIVNRKKQAVALYATALINKPSWYEHKSLNTIRLVHPNKIKQKKLLAELKRQGKSLQKTIATIPYVPLSSLFGTKNKPDMYLFSQIPNGAIIEIVRPNWDLRKQIGTCLNVSHLGFAIWKKHRLYFREASSHFGQVTDIPLVKYLKDALDSPTIKGINIQVLKPKEPNQIACSMHMKP